MKINQIWQELENTPSDSQSLLIRRYAGSILPDIYVALKIPEKTRCIAAVVSKNIKLTPDGFTNLRDINIRIIPDNISHDRQMVLFELLSSQHQDIFSVLCEDLMTSIETVRTESVLVKELFNRFEKWKSLFETARSPGLLAEEQRGLYGELFLLNKLLHININYYLIINTWVGCEKQIRDFQYRNWSIEVKTSQSNNHQRLHINNERQLDSSKTEYLFLFHLSIETRQKAGSTLNNMISSIRELLQKDFRSLNRFNAKLIEGGYYNHHATIYDDHGYLIRKEVFYRVHKDFPRIEEKDIRNGVGDVNYSIIVSQAADYIIDEQQVLQSLNLDE